MKTGKWPARSSLCRISKCRVRVLSFLPSPSH